MSIFKVDDLVYKLNSEAGKIIRVEPGGVTVKWKPETTAEWMSTETANKRLSFTPYDLINGGFSQERPKPEIENGTVIFVRKNAGELWQVAKFIRYINDGVQVEDYDGSPIDFSEYSLENPLI